MGFTVSNTSSQSTIADNTSSITDIDNKNRLAQSSGFSGGDILDPSLARGSASPISESAEIDYEQSKKAGGLDDHWGSPSLFNKYAIFVHPKANSKNGFKLLKDVRGQEKIYNTTNPTLRDIIDNLKNDPTRRLLYSDFAYAKFYEKMPYNRLIVLRRFPFPTYNNLSFAQKGSSTTSNSAIKPLAKAITYFGEEAENTLSELISISGYKEYKELTAELDLVLGKNKGLDDSPYSGLNQRMNKGLKVFSALTKDGDLSGRSTNDVDVLMNKNWENERKGPENVIHKTMIADVGVGATLSFTLKFEYKLRSYNNVNPRVAILDLISNLMTLVHTNAQFWGGQNIILPNHQQFPFIGDENEFYSGNYGKYLGSVVDWFSEPFKSGGTFQGLIDGIMSGDLSSLGNFLQSVGSKALDLQSAKSRESITGLKALLDASPIGNYHISIGNPLQPWLQLGNLIVKTWELTFDDMIGHNDLPTGLKLSVDVETATPLDSTGVQGIFNIGGASNRMYFKPEDFFNSPNGASMGGEKFTNKDIERGHGAVY